MEMVLFLTGFLVALIGTLAGSGGLIGMPIMLLLGIPVHISIATAKFSNIISSSSSFGYLLRDKRVTLSECLPILPIALIGGMTGAVIADQISTKILETIAFLFLIMALFLSINKGIKPKGNHKQRRTLFGYLLFISTYDGMFGPGQATMLMYTHLLHGSSYLKSIALTRFQTFVSCLGAFAIYFQNGHVDWSIGIPFAAGAFLGASLAVRIAKKIDISHVKLLLNFITMILILQFGIKLFFS
ncbi:sulfite exporter TauE/SafE family protein [Rossellomorea aquimaris]|uniref:sulfite exporter TauE/SafE family protein n=1 Tax=Rossellomorea aquimaris TaxID=189382 RepID=UPI0007D05030|nr:sulfite exporter TauE/SafE family protein [Rossellomorea aquimaris]